MLAGELPGAITNATQLEGVGHKRILMLNVGAPLVGVRFLAILVYLLWNYVVTPVS